MTPGKVVRIRVSPADCMAVCDIVERLGGLPPGTSFAQAVSLALASAMQTLREHSVVPTREGYEFSQLMAKYPMGDSREARRRALEITSTLKLANPGHVVRPVAPAPHTNRPPVGMARYEELAFKLSNDSLNMTDAERDELSDLTQKLFPEAP